MSDLLCPSANHGNGMTILGEGPGEDRLNYLPPGRTRHLYEFDLTTVRLAGPCITTNCLYWNDRCELGKSISTSAVELRLTNLPHCSIRPGC
jgi:hypothetical protein